MTDWFKSASTRKLDQFSDLIKNELKKSISVRRVFEQFDVPIELLDTLVVKILPLKGKLALTDANEMKLNESLLSSDFFENSMFVVCHEIVHFICRQAEKRQKPLLLPRKLVPEKPTKSENGYFNDNEERLAFVLAVAYELEKGRELQKIYKKVFPKIEWHFHDPKDAKIFFNRIIRQAKELAE